MWQFIEPTATTKSFVYVEANPELPVGIYKYDDDDLARKVEAFGHADEEYALVGTTPITRAEYDDGSAVIDGKVVKTAGVAKLRLRHLTQHNLVLAPQFSPINSHELDEQFQRVLDRILVGLSDIDEIIKVIEAAPRHRNDG